MSTQTIAPNVANWSERDVIRALREYSPSELGDMLFEHFDAHQLRALNDSLQLAAHRGAHKYPADVKAAEVDALLWQTVTSPLQDSFSPDRLKAMVDADPKMAALIASKETEAAELVASRKTLGYTVEQASVYTAMQSLVARGEVPTRRTVVSEAHRLHDQYVEVTQGLSPAELRARMDTPTYVDPSRVEDWMDQQNDLNADPSYRSSYWMPVQDRLDWLDAADRTERKTVALGVHVDGLDQGEVSIRSQEHEFAGSELN